MSMDRHNPQGALQWLLACLLHRAHLRRVSCQKACQSVSQSVRPFASPPPCTSSLRQDTVRVCSRRAPLDRKKKGPLFQGHSSIHPSIGRSAAACANGHSTYLPGSTDRQGEGAKASHHQKLGKTGRQAGRQAGR
ncbi:hypothetical protein F4780DRAFT_633005 [Xylariomycetidae sp. FL0641]|nr:hypothetical protein F4780DRAFT_633005 [Xylariomycetidae sp. FL0641]